MQKAAISVDLGGEEWIMKHGLPKLWRLLIEVQQNRWRKAEKLLEGSFRCAGRRFSVEQKKFVNWGACGGAIAGSKSTIRLVCGVGS